MKITIKELRGMYEINTKYKNVESFSVEYEEDLSLIIKINNKVIFNADFYNHIVKEIKVN